MKTMRNSVLVTLVALIMSSLAGAQEFKEKPDFPLGVCMSIDNAIRVPGLMKAMYQQVTKEDVIEAHLHLYVAKVVYNGMTYSIYGTFDQWMRFFLMDGYKPVPKYRSSNKV